MTLASDFQELELLSNGCQATLAVLEVIKTALLHATKSSILYIVRVFIKNCISRRVV